MKRLILLLCILLIGCNSHDAIPENIDKSIETQNNKPDVIISESELSIERELEVEISNVVAQEISYESDNLRIKGFEVRPKNVNDIKYPTIIYNRGGNNGFGKISDDFAIDFFSKFAEEGFVVLASQYRGKHSEGDDEFGGEDLNDVNNIIDLVYSLEYVDQERIYMIGFSRGSMMTLMSIKNRDDIKAAVVIGTISNLFDTYDNREDEMKKLLIDCIGGTPEEVEDEYVKRSAMFWSDDIDVPLLMLHGSDDWRVSSSQAKNLKEALDNNGTTNKLIIYKDAGHNLGDNYLESINEILTWFKKY